MALNLYMVMGINVLVCMNDGWSENLVHNKDKSFCLKNNFFWKYILFSKKMSQTKTLFWLIQAPNTCKHISRNKGATMKDSRKIADDKVSFNFLVKLRFFQKNGSTLKKYSSKSVYWYQCFSVWKVVGVESLVHGRPGGPMLLP